MTVYAFFARASSIIFTKSEKPGETNNDNRISSLILHPSLSRMNHPPLHM